MQCLRCGKEIGTGRALCPDCLAQGREHKIEVLDQHLEKRRNVGFQSLVLQLRSIIIVLCLGGLLVYAATRPPRPFPMPTVTLRSTSQGSGYSYDPCTGKERCLVAYLATWCPACHGSLGFVSGIRNAVSANPRAGVKIVVGGGDESEIRAMASQIGGTVFMDTEGQFAGALGGFAVPHWWVVDKQGMALSHFSGGYSEFNPETRRAFAETKLKAEASYFFPN